MDKPKYFFYARKSTEDEDKQVMSIEAQLFELREFAKRENLEILEEFQESKSAKKPGREIFAEMMMEIEKLDGVGILSWHPDRLARNSVDGGRIVYLVDTGKILSLRFPTFWFEPTPQGLFMLQVAFGQSKYYSDNLSENVKRGIRQKLRRKEWPGRAPFGYVNNPKTRNIDPDPVKSKIIKRAFEEFATGKYGFGSLAEFLAELGLETKNRTPLAKSAIYRMLTNPVYLGFIKHRGEIHEGSHKPILSSATFEAVQKILKQKSRPRRSRKSHNFPFTGLLACGECGSSITAQWAKGHGGIYRYYRCTKKKGNCGQGYLQEKQLAEQLKERLQSVALYDAWAEKMLAKVNEWEKEKTQASQTFAQNLENNFANVEAKLDKLVSAYLDGDIEKPLYLEKKEKLMRQKLVFETKKKDFGQKGKNWNEPLRRWILDLKQAKNLAVSENYPEIKSMIQKIGTNLALSEKTVSLDFLKPFDLAAFRLAKCGLIEAVSPAAKPLPSHQNAECSCWSAQ